ncbi:MBL fold metallo-hydrolase [Pararhodobacter aggregans]|uniref:MBL fold metallo-hydrolase n=1 Tax=Pararhodobacter aggregans TaxID=404875 RepID=UPI000D46FB3D|nr:MBL fold metallo-hydrolase [Pararhodobacter aggregans]PTX03022.1 glyoxylase-like metal-dependent hydrolase (beta-lactamase superfamily II) [Pararhodobacter aggregans]
MADDRSPAPVTALRPAFDAAPAYGEVREIAKGLLWTRIPLPYQLDHVNIYLVQDGEGWAVIDTGIKTDAALATWEQLLAGPLKGKAISRVIATHHHPDHIGLAGWLCEKFDAPLLTSYSTYMGSKVISLGADEGMTRNHFNFYTRHGMSEEVAGVVAIQGNEYLRRVANLPITFLRLVMADVLEIGGRSFRVLIGDGHAPEQVMLYCDDERLLFAADQVIERISPNISVYANEPNGDPLGHFLRSLRFLRQEIPGDVLVLPGHRLPFYGLHQRCAELEAHHEERCDLIREACASAPRTVADLVPILFPRPLDPHQMTFAFTETLAHVNRLVRRGEIETIRQEGRLVSVPARRPG